MSRSVLSTMCRRCQTQFQKHTISFTRPFSSITTNSQEIDPLAMFEKAIRPPSNVRQKPPPPVQKSTPATQNNPLQSLVQGAHNEASTRPSSGASDTEPYHLNIYAHRHNMHITFTEPSRNPIISYSAGNIGLRKAQRGSFDAAYQLSAYTMRKMVEKQWRIGGKDMSMNKMLTLNEPEVRERGIEVVLRGYGPGREAFQKALLGTEGKLIKPLIKRVTDSTRLKFGGTRSPQVRRLG